jgi:6-phosphogluconolactonase
MYDLDSTSGKLTQRGSFAVEGSPGPLALSPDGKTLYAGLSKLNGVQALRVGDDGSLTPLGTTPLQQNPVALAVDATGKHLAACDYGSGVLASHPINADGTVNATPSERRVVGKNPHSVYFDPHNRFLIVPALGEDAILQFRFDAATGKFTPNNPPRVDAQLRDGPRHFAFHPSLKFAFGCNEHSSTVTAYRYDAKAGTLSVIERVSTLPGAPDPKNTTADVHVTPDGRHLYVSNRVHDSLAGFRVDESTGKLTPIGHTPTEAIPRAFNLDLTGNFVISAGQKSGRLATYRLDPATGELRPLEVIEVGKGPAWVLPLWLPAESK